MSTSLNLMYEIVNEIFAWRDKLTLALGTVHIKCYQKNREDVEYF